MKVASIPAVAGLVAICATTACHDTTPAPTSQPSPSATTTQAALRDDMRALWTQNAVWTRVAVIGTMARLADLEAATNRLFENEVAIATSFKPFVSADTEKQLVTLFGDQSTRLVDAMDATQKGDVDAFDSATNDWLTDADQIAHLLATSNASWSEATLKDMFHESLKQTLVEVTNRAAGNYADDVGSFDGIETDSLTIADALTDGLAAGFPELVSTASPPSVAVESVHLAMRKIWEENAAWTRFFIISDMNQLPDLALTKQRLLSNPMDLRNVLEPYYGAGSDVVAGVTMAQIMDAAQVIDATARGDQVTANRETVVWTADADRIARSFADLSAAFSERDIDALLRTHINQTITEVSDRAQEDWTGDANEFDLLESGIDALADSLSSSVNQDFPAGPTAPM